MHYFTSFLFCEQKFALFCTKRKGILSPRFDLGVVGRLPSVERVGVPVMRPKRINAFRKRHDRRTGASQRIPLNQLSVRSQQIKNIASNHLAHESERGVVIQQIEKHTVLVQFGIGQIPQGAAINTQPDIGALVIELPA